jgi:uncharacterized RDD family membrane protein YckC
MNPNPKALSAGVALAALCLLCIPAFAADPAPASPTPIPTAALTPTPTAALTPTPTAALTPTPTAALRELSPGKPADDVGIIVDSGNGIHPSRRASKGDDRVAIMGSVLVGPDEEVDGSSVAVLGSVVVNGTVDEDAVAVMGSNTINGTVHGNAVSVMGNLHLGPNARVDGDVVCVGGRYTRSASATVGGREVEKEAGAEFSENPELRAWMHHGLGMGRPFAVGEHLLVFSLFGLLMLGLCLLISLAFPGGVARCGETLTHRPGITFLTGILGILALPILFVLLLITIVGIPVDIVVLPLALVSCILFGKAAIYSLVGRSILGRQSPVVLATLVGGLLFVALYFVPFLGGALWLVVAFLGFSCVLTTLFTYSRTPAPVAAAPTPAIPPVVPPSAPAVPLAESSAQASATAPVPLEAPPVVAAPAAGPHTLSLTEEAALPRAGFWIRMAALLIDVILVGVVTQVHHVFLPFLAMYGAVLWKLKGSTVGGIIFGLKVVRVDGKPAEWVTMVVRALACFFSLIVVGLGFFWIAFDREKQAWHDKIAGTVVVRLPKGASLV